MTLQDCPTFDRFVAAMRKILDGNETDEPRMLAAVEDELRRLVAVDDWLPDIFATPDPARYRQFLLHHDQLRNFSVVSFVWGPGQQTPIHDHCVWGAIGMLRGAEVNEMFERADSAMVGCGEQRLEPGEVALVSPLRGDIHKVRNAFDDRVSVSIHVYGGNIGAIRRHSYSLAGEMKPFISGYSDVDGIGDGKPGRC